MACSDVVFTYKTANWSGDLHVRPEWGATTSPGFGMRHDPRRPSFPCAHIARLQPQASSSAPEPQAPETPYTREFRSLGSKVIESNQPFEEPPTKDMWEGDQFEVGDPMMQRQ